VLMVNAVLFDLFETLITESRTRPPGVSSLARALGCDREAFRGHWKALRPAVTLGRLSFRQALSDMTTRLGRPADDRTLQQLCDDRIRTKAEPFEQCEHQVLMMIDYLRSREIRVGVVSNCFAEDVAAWPQSSLASRVDCTVFSFEVGLAKPDPEIYREAARRLQVDVSHTWFIGDGGHEELSGAEQAGLRPFRAIWFLRRWPHFREEPASIAAVAAVGEIVSLVERAIGPPDGTRCGS
jgi:HAD superfamily hydrolase (TIGR01549 family)